MAPSDISLRAGELQRAWRELSVHVQSRRADLLLHAESTQHGAPARPRASVFLAQPGRSAAPEVLPGRPDPAGPPLAGEAVD